MALCCTAVLQGLLELGTSDLLELGPGLATTGRVLVGTGRYHDPVIMDGWSGYQYERNQVRTTVVGSSTSGTALGCDWQASCRSALSRAHSFLAGASVGVNGLVATTSTLPTACLLC
jgi:hypothetical protein